MRLLAVHVNGILDLRNMLPVTDSLLSLHGAFVDVLAFRPELTAMAGNYDGLIVGSDWNKNRFLVQEFREKKKFTALLQSEGMFISEKSWYVGKAPKTHLACVWGSRHAKIFKERAYDGRIVISGPPRFDVYRSFVPKLDRQELLSKIQIVDASKRYVLFVGQFFPEHEFGIDYLEGQKELTRLAGRLSSDIHVVFKCHPQETPAIYFSRRQLILEQTQDKILRTKVIIDERGHEESLDISTLIFHASAVITHSSTVAMEAVFLGTPVGIFDNELTSSALADGRLANLPRIKNEIDIKNLMNSIVDRKNISKFIAEFLPGRIDGKNTERAASAIYHHAYRFKKTHS